MVYNSNQVAEIVGVNVSTIKRWTLSGKLNCLKTPGGHRKFHVNHIKELLKSNKDLYTNIDISKLVGSNKKILDAISNKNYKFLIRYCSNCLVSGESNKFFSLCNSLVLIGNSYDSIFDDIIIPLLDHIGKQWLDGKISISEEHMASVKIRKFLSDLNNNFNYKNKSKAFSFTLINDEHDIPLYMSEIILNEAKVEVFNLGPNLPMNDLINLYEKHNPKFIFISLVYTDNIIIVNSELNLLCKKILNKNTKVFLKGHYSNEINLDYDNYIILDSFKALKSQLV